MVIGTLDKFLMNPDFHMCKVRIVMSATPTSIVTVNSVINKAGYVVLPTLLCDCYGITKLHIGTLSLSSVINKKVYILWVLGE